MNLWKSDNKLLLIWVLLLCGALYQGQAFAKAYVLIAGGLGGNPEYAESFAATVAAIEENFTPGSQWLGTETVLSVYAGDNVDKAMLLNELQTFTQQIGPDDSLVLMLIGHGSYDGTQYRFNIPGPDLTDTDIKRALDSIQAQRQLVVLATSASGVMLQQLDQPGRIVITATKSGGEINAVAFPQYWAAALTTDKADYDKNEIVTVSEAFRYTQTAVNSHYTEQNLLASEHARLLGDGADNEAVALIGSLKNAGDDPVIAQLLDKRSVLQNELTALRETKDSVDTADYYVSLQELMLRMARLQLEIDRKTGWLNSSE